VNIPPGFGTVTPYCIVRGAEVFMEFLVGGLGGKQVLRHLDDDGRIKHAQVQLGSSMVMLCEATTDFPPMPSSYYLYVEDADRAVARALAAGATLVMAVEDKPYGDRQGGVRDACGNYWWISQRLQPGPY
jgi:PhnB protein